MPALFIFLLKVNLALIIFCLGYYLVLRKLTFYTLNRIYLVGAIVLSSVYPLIDVNDLLAGHQEIAAPVQVIAINWQASQQIMEQPAYWLWAIILFWLGAAVFAMRLLIQFLSLYKLYRKSTPAVIQQYSVRVTDADISPFSFWKNIYLNPGNIEAADLNSVLEHEHVHVKQWHTLDILLTEFSVIFYWFNPGVWLMKRAVRENIEFITDRKVLQKGTDTKAYQYSLLHVSIAGTTTVGISNHFNFSTLKKRIKMMNTKKSSNLNLTRYAVLVPMVVVLLMVFSFSKAELIKNNREQLTEFISETVNIKPTEPKKDEMIAPAAKRSKIKYQTSKDTTKIESKVQFLSIKGINLPIGVPYAFFQKTITKLPTPS
ncbi:M56 family metallopeptidase [Mucilaginibacter antarcticus]|uniref:M56 family metallopeptidase n=1 Tax=Mucilaginibacter antarcticus TaxID=1855725 RepID=UPI0036322D13